MKQLVNNTAGCTRHRQLKNSGWQGAVVLLLALVLVQPALVNSRILGSRNARKPDKYRYVSASDWTSLLATCSSSYPIT